MVWTGLPVSGRRSCAGSCLGACVRCRHLKSCLLHLLLYMQGIKAAFEEATKLATNPVKAALLVLLRGQVGKDRLSPDAKKVTAGQGPVFAER